MWTLVKAAAQVAGQPMPESEFQKGPPVFVGALQARKVPEYPIGPEQDSEGESSRQAPSAGKRRRADEEEGCQPAPKKPKTTPANERAPAAIRRPSAGKRTTGPCSHCHAKSSPQWRNIEMGDEQTVVMCNACGLYYNKHGELRPLPQ